MQSKRGWGVDRKKGQQEDEGKGEGHEREAGNTQDAGQA